ncbi:MAG TPA: hypothetical protein HPP69_12215 [Deltaproteobacteria bacterium]|nr:hypothetical protein [Deltaproteobacteria bacterium]
MTWSAGLQPWLRPYAEALVSYGGSNVTVSSVYRSYSKQLELRNRWEAYRAQGYTSQEIGERFGLWTPALPGRSKHQQGRAFDVSGPKEWLTWLGAVWKSWGGRWWESDPVHFEA